MADKQNTSGPFYLRMGAMSRTFQECWWFNKTPCQDPGIQLSSRQFCELAPTKSCILYLGKVKRQLEQGRVNIETLPV